MTIIEKIKELRTGNSDGGGMNKLVLGIVSAIAVASAGTAGIAAAQGNGPPSFVTNCKANFQKLGFKNVGQCISHNNGHGHGYGG